MEDRTSSAMVASSATSSGSPTFPRHVMFACVLFSYRFDLGLCSLLLCFWSSDLISLLHFSPLFECLQINFPIVCAFAGLVLLWFCPVEMSTRVSPCSETDF